MKRPGIVKTVFNLRFRPFVFFFKLATAVTIARDKHIVSLFFTVIIHLLRPVLSFVIFKRPLPRGIFVDCTSSYIKQYYIKLKAIESERMSLVTVIKVLQSDQNLHENGSGDPSTQTTAKWNTKTPEFEKQSQKTESSKLPPGENTIQLNNRFNALAVDESVHEVEPNVLSQGQISPLENPNLTNLPSTPYPSNPTTSKARVLDNQTENDAEIGASAAQTDASKNLEGPIVIIGDSIIKDIIP